MPPKIEKSRLALKKTTFEVEAILDSRINQVTKKTEFLVKWTNFSDQHNTWEPEKNLGNCQRKVGEYFDRIALQKNMEHSRQSGSTRKRSSSVPRKQGKKTCNKRQLDFINFKVEDDIDVDLFGITTKAFSVVGEWKLFKNRKGKYTLYRRGYESDDDSDANSVTSNSNSSETAGSERNSLVRMRPEVVQQKLKDWERQINDISRAANEEILLVENTVDDAILPSCKFTFVTEWKLGDQVNLPMDVLVGCECKNCYEEEKCCPAQMNAEFAYNKRGRLSLEMGRPIYECNNKCGCGPDCKNRVIQKGRQTKLCIFRTEKCGWGVKAVEPIKKGTFVTEYVGEEAGKRRNTTYMFNMDYDGDAKYVVDARNYGNVSHFINHSCDPNLAVFGAWIEHYDSALPRLAFFTAREIAANEELTFDYASRRDTGDQHTEESQSSSGSRKSKQKCYCMSASCRKYIF